MLSFKESIELSTFDDIQAPKIAEDIIERYNFTITSVIRSYFWRRWFNNKIHEKLHKWFRKV